MYETFRLSFMTQKATLVDTERCAGGTKTHQLFDF